VAVHQGRQERDQMDSAVVPDLHRQCCPPPAPSHRYDFGNFMRTLALPKATAAPSLLTPSRELPGSAIFNGGMTFWSGAYMKAMQEKALIEVSEMEFVIVGMQRSGTTVLTKMLDSHPDVVCLHEVFHPEAAGIQSFTSYCVTYAQVQDLVSLSGRATLFRNYLKSVASTTKVSNVGFNVKYGSCHQLESDWIDYLKRPALFDLIQSWNGKVIHVIRRNSFLQALSIILARNSGIWHIQEGLQVSRERMYVDTNELIHVISDIDMLVLKFSGYLDDDPNAHKIYYEEMFEECAFSSGIAVNLAAFLGISSEFDLIPKLSKVSTVDWRADVTNWQTVERTVLSSRFL
jgi:LPS sulfotransferase NodH